MRVGSGLVTFPVWAFASDGARGSRVSVHFPRGYDVSVESGDFDSRTETADGGVTLATEPLGEPLSYFAYLTRPAGGGLQGDAAHRRGRRRRHRPAGPRLARRPRLGRAHRRPVQEGAAGARREIGLAWPEAEPTVVQEAVSRAAGGYAGLFAPAERRIEVAYWADPLVVLHEAAHGWFNGGLVADRWASEGFASLYAQRAAHALKVKDTSPKLTAAASKAAIPLNAWANTAGSRDHRQSADRDLRVRRLARARPRDRRAGRGRRAAARVGGRQARVGAYQPRATPPFGGPVDPETVDGPPDWRGLLDLLEAETGQDFTDLWRQWVVRPEEASLLDARSDARTAYVRTLAVAGDWQLPRGVRDALRAWQFDEAVQQLADARTVLAQRGAIESLAARGSMTLPADHAQHFQAGDMVGASTEAEAERNAMLAVIQAADARVHDDDVLSRIGMLGEDPEADIVAARAAFAAGDLAGAQSAADDAYRAWTAAWQEGRRRALLVLGRAGRRPRPRGRRRGSCPRRASGADGLDRRGLLSRMRRTGHSPAGRRRDRARRRPVRPGGDRAAGGRAHRGIAPFLAALDAPVALAADDLEVSTKARYVVAPNGGRVRVTVDVNVLNQKPNRVAGGVITRYFYDG